MNKRDKDKLLILLVIILYIIMSVGMIIGTSYLTWKMIIGITVILEYIIIQPKICRLYYEVNNNKANAGRFIPFWNEIMMFNNKAAIAALLSYALLALTVIMLFIPIEVVGNLLGDKIMLNYGVFMIRVIAVAVIINCICVGLGFTGVGNKIRRLHMDFTDTKSNVFATSILATVLLYLPIIRAVTLTGYMNTLIKLVVLNNYAKGANNSEHLVEED